MAWFSWLKKKEDPEDYEKILSNLSLEIQKKQTRLSEVRLRERRSTLLVTLYTFAAWAFYVAIWWAFLQHRSFAHRKYATTEHVIKILPTVLGPIGILCVRRLVQVWYTNKGNAEEKTLKALLVEQRNKLEEIKKKTNYYATRNLLERYDDGPSKLGPSTPNNQLRQRNAKGGPGGPLAKPAPNAIKTQGVPPSGQPPLPSALLRPSPATPLPPPRKQWYDKLADTILGDDSASALGDKTKYALICENCFNHNGLCREEEWEDMKYVCPKCNHFNPSPRQKRGEDMSYPHSRAQSILARSVPGTAQTAEFRSRSIDPSAPPTAVFQPERELPRTPPPAGLAGRHLHPPSSPLNQVFDSSSDRSASSSPSAREPRGRSSPGTPPGNDAPAGDVAMDVDDHKE